MLLRQLQQKPKKAPLKSELATVMLAMKLNLHVVLKLNECKSLSYLMLDFDCGKVLLIA